MKSVAGYRRRRWPRIAPAHRLAGAALLLAAGMLPVFAAGKTPAGVAASFCETRLSGEDEFVRSLLTPSLLKAIIEAEDRNLAAIETAPDDKPPLGDGIPYQSFLDAPDKCVPGKPEEKPGNVELPVTYSFTETPSAGWTDTLHLVPAGGGYLIDDIMFIGSADGSAPPSLRSVLRDAFDR